MTSTVPPNPPPGFIPPGFIPPGPTPPFTPPNPPSKGVWSFLTGPNPPPPIIARILANNEMRLFLLKHKISLRLRALHTRFRVVRVLAGAGEILFWVLRGSVRLVLRTLSRIYTSFLFRSLVTTFAFVIAQRYAPLFLPDLSPKVAVASPSLWSRIFHTVLTVLSPVSTLCHIITSLLGFSRGAPLPSKILYQTNGGPMTSIRNYITQAANPENFPQDPPGLN